MGKVVENGFCDRSGCNNWPECNYQEPGAAPPCARGMDAVDKSAQQPKHKSVKHCGVCMGYSGYCRYCKNMDKFIQA